MQARLLYGFAFEKSIPFWSIFAVTLEFHYWCFRRSLLTELHHYHCICSCRKPIRFPLPSSSMFLVGLDGSLPWKQGSWRSRLHPSSWGCPWTLLNIPLEIIDILLLTKVIKSSIKIRTNSNTFGQHSFFRFLDFFALPLSGNSDRRKLGHLGIDGSTICCLLGKSTQREKRKSGELHFCLIQRGTSGEWSELSVSGLGAEYSAASGNCGYLIFNGLGEFELFL